MERILAQGLADMGILPPQGAVDKLCRYAQLLLEQNQVMNLTAITQPQDVVRLHFLDSAGILMWTGSGESRVPRPTENSSTWLSHKTVVDVGTGAGFPGMVLKILEPSISLTLVDSLGKRLIWLEEVCKVLSLDGVQCVHGRAEELSLEPPLRDGFDVATSRAVAAYPALCELCLPYVKPGGVFLAMKSVESAAETESGLSALKRLGGKALGNQDYSIPGTDVTHRLVGAAKIAPTPKGLPRSWGKIKRAAL